MRTLIVLQFETFVKIGSLKFYRASPITSGYGLAELLRYWFLLWQAIVEFDAASRIAYVHVKASVSIFIL